jgi:HK97 family phage prohead protease
MNKLQRMIAEIRAGRVLSAANESKLRAAMESLQAVLEQLGIEETDSERASGVSLEQRFATIEGLEVRAEADKPATILGHAALFDTKSVYMMGFRETIEKGAFSESLTGDIRALWQHDTARVLGRTKAGTLRLWEDDQGLAFELNPPDTQDGRDAVTLIERGDVDQMSFGFNVPSGGDTWAEDEDGIPLRKLRAVSLMEISPVTWAAYPQTGVGVMRNAPKWVVDFLSPGVDDSSTADDSARLQTDLMLKRLNLFKYLGA